MKQLWGQWAPTWSQESKQAKEGQRGRYHRDRGAPLGTKVQAPGRERGGPRSTLPSPAAAESVPDLVHWASGVPRKQLSAQEGALPVPAIPSPHLPRATSHAPPQNGSLGLPARDLSAPGLSLSRGLAHSQLRGACHVAGSRPAEEMCGWRLPEDENCSPDCFLRRSVLLLGISSAKRPAPSAP